MIDESILEIDAEAEPDDDELPGDLTANQLATITLSASDWTTETILSQLERGNIDLSPRFQRRDAWQAERKSRFVESLILNFPVPQIVLAERKGMRNQYIVLDGKQRLTALLKFSGKTQEQDPEPLNGFSLTNLQVLTHLNGKTYSDFVNDDSLVRELTDLHNQTIRTVVVRNWEDDAALHMIFVRLNTSSVPLSPQELRQALYPGAFANFIDDHSYDSGALRSFMGLDHADFRMRDVELLLRFLAFHFFIKDYTGNMSKFLNDTAKSLSSQFDDDSSLVEDAIQDFDAALQAAISIFGDDGVARKWLGDDYEKRWNRAILDVLLFYFASREVREASMMRKSEIVEAYKSLFNENSRFRNAVESTTKSLTATYDRFVLWGNALDTILPMSLRIPEWNDKKNRLVLPSRAN